ncbi:hypothetical protein L9F63_008009, partial [Diploptera punctata]
LVDCTLYLPSDLSANRRTRADNIRLIMRNYWALPVAGSYFLDLFKCVFVFSVDLQLVFGIDVSGVYDDWWSLLSNS